MGGRTTTSAQYRRVLTEDEVGIKKSSLLHAGLADGGVILNKKAMIQQGELIRGPRADKENK